MRSALRLCFIGAYITAVPVSAQQPADSTAVPTHPGLTKSPYGWSKIRLYSFIGGGKVPAGPYQPLTKDERLELFLKSTLLSKDAPLRTFLSASRRQIQNSPPGWDGSSGFLRRAGSRYTAFMVRNSTEAGVQALLGHEPRYVPCECSGFFPRFGHALLFTVVTRDEKGRLVPDVGRIAGRFAGEFTVEAMYPGPYDQWHAVRSGTRWFTWGWVFNVMREFSPEIRRKLRLGQ